ncbi:MAG: hypothetical protein ACE5FK_08715 [Candidatus Methylomirabilia bacterium]
MFVDLRNPLVVSGLLAIPTKGLTLGAHHGSHRLARLRSGSRQVLVTPGMTRGATVRLPRG